MTQYYTYILKDSTTNQPFYVGKGTGPRMYQHKKEALREDYKKRSVHCKIISIINRGDEILYEKIEQPTEEDAFALELELIKQYGRKDLGTGILCNLTEGGEGAYRRSKESIELTASKHRGMKRSEKSKQHMRDAQIKLRLSGLVTTEESKLKMSHERKQRPKQTKLTIEKRKKSLPKRKVIQMDLSFNIIKEWESMSLAAQTLNIDLTNIYRSCYFNGKNSAGGFKWKYLTDNKQKQNYRISQYTLDDKFIKFFDTTSEAAKSVNVHFSSIIYCCNGKTNTCAGFKWKYVLSEHKRKTKSNKPVFQYDLQNNFIAQFPSARAAALYIGCDPSPILQCCNNHPQYKTASGFIWKRC